MSGRVIVYLIFFSVWNFHLAFAFGQNASSTHLQQSLDSAHFYLQKSDSKNTFKFLNVAEDYIRSKGNDFKYGELYLLKAGAFFIGGSFERSEKCYNLSIKHSLTSQDTLNYLKSLVGLTSIYIQTGKWEKLDQIDLVLSTVLTSEKYKQQEIEAKKNVAVSYIYRQDYKKAIDKLQQLIEPAKQLENKKLLLEVYFNLSTIYAEIGDNEYALYLLKKAQSLDNNLDHRMSGSIFSSIGGIQSNTKQTTEAISNYKRAIQHFEKINFAIGLLYCNSALSIIHQERNEVQLSLYYLNKVQSANQLLNQPLIQGLYYLTKAKIEQKRGDFSSALKYADSSLVLSKELVDLSRQKEAYEIKASIYEEQNDVSNGFVFLKLAKTMSDSIANTLNLNDQKNKSLLSELKLVEKDHQIAKKELIIKSQEVRNNRTIYLSIAMFILLISIAVVLFLRQRLMKSKMSNELAEKRVELEILQKKLFEEELSKEKEISQNLKGEIETKNLRLQELALEITEKNKRLTTLNQEGKTDANSKIVREIEKLILSPEELNFLNAEIQLLENNFQNKLKIQFPTLSDYDLELSTMIKLGLTSKEIASIMSIESNSVDVSRYRLRKKLGIQKGVEITDFLNSFVL